MRMNVTILVLFLLVLAGPLGASTKSPAVVALGNLCRVLEAHRSGNAGALPADWNDLDYSNRIVSSLMEEVDRYLAPQGRYQFVNPPIEINSFGAKLKVVLIANRAGEEGNGPKMSGSTEVADYPGRFLIVEAPSGRLETRRFEEDELSKMFQVAGADLTRYTTASRPLPSPGTMTPEARKRLADSHRAAAEEGRKAGAVAEDKSVRNLNWGAFAAVAGLLAVFIVVIFWARKSLGSKG